MHDSNDLTENLHKEVERHDSYRRTVSISFSRRKGKTDFTASPHNASGKSGVNVLFDKNFAKICMNPPYIYALLSVPSKTAGSRIEKDISLSVSLGVNKPRMR